MFADPKQGVRWEGVPCSGVGEDVCSGERSIVDRVASCVLVSDAESVYAVACFGIATILAASQVKSDVLTFVRAGSYCESL